MALEGVDWGANRKTVLLALQTTCHFCTESAPFYRKLSERVSGVRIVAVLPQPVDVSRRYLSEIGVPIREVRQMRLAELKVSATPTIVLIDGSGKVERVWVGRMSHADEEALLSLN